MQRYGNDVYLRTLGPDSIKTASVPWHSGRKKRVGSNIKFKRWRGTNAVLDERVFLTAQQIVSHRSNGYGRFTAEAVGYMLNVRVDQVRQSLHRLNLAGKVSQAAREHAHDTNRAPFFWGTGSGWAANSYSLTE